MEELFRPTAQLKIALTPDCNNDCPICLNRTTRKRNGRPRILSIRKMKDTISEGSDLGMIGTYWTGGEPMMEYNNLLELIRYSKQLKMLPSMVSNGGLIGAYGKYRARNKQFLLEAGIGTLQSRDIVDSLCEVGLERIYFSIDNSHSTLIDPDEGIENIVPTAVAASAIAAFMDAGFATKNSLDAIGHKLRITATSSGQWYSETTEILDDVISRINAELITQPSPSTQIYGNEKGVVYVKRLKIATLGDAIDLDERFWDDRAGDGLFDIKCPHFIPRNMAYDGGAFHGDLFVDYDGIVYTCGDHSYAVGNILEESLTDIIRGINTHSIKGKYGSTRAVFRRLLILSQELNFGDTAIGEAFRLINNENSELLAEIKTQCGSCNSLGHDFALQQAFLDGFEKAYGKSI